MIASRRCPPAFVFLILWIMPQAVLSGDAFFEHITNRDGLSQMSINAILQDRRGFLWIGTEDGLNRYDGYEIKVFKNRPGEGSSLSNGWIQALLEDRDGALWIGTREGLNRRDPETGEITHHWHDPDLSDNPRSDIILSLHLGREGALWVGTESGLDRLVFDTETRRGLLQGFYQETVDQDGVPADAKPRDFAVLAIEEERGGGLWLGTRADGLIRIDQATGNWTRFLHNEIPGSLGAGEVTSLSLGDDGRLWIGTSEGGLQYFMPSEEHFVSYLNDPDDSGSLSNNAVEFLLHDRHGTLWVATQGGGLNSLAAGADRFEHFRHDPRNATSLSYDILLSLHEDRDGALWVGTLGKGIHRLDPRERFTHVRHDPNDPDSLSSSVVLALREDRRGELWVGTVGGGLNRRDEATGRFMHYRHDPNDPQSLGSDLILAFYEDRSGVLWTGGRDSGLNRYEPTTDNFSRLLHDPSNPDSLANNDIQDLAEDREGNLWVGTRGGLSRLDPSRSRFKNYFHDRSDPQSLSNDRVHAITVDSSGQVWIGTFDGLNRFDPANENFNVYRHDAGNPESLSHDLVWAVSEDRSGHLWIGTGGGGLNLYSPENDGFTAYTEADGLVNNSVYGVLEDDLGRLWISTNDGIARLDRAADRWISYDVNDGLQDQEFNFGAYYRSVDGTMYFGGIGGFNAFVPERFVESSRPPALVITSFKVLEEEYPGEAAALREVELGHHENFFSLDLAALTLSRAEQNRYRYRLEALDEDWIDAGQRRYVSYTSVPPGEYVFRARAANADGVWNDEGIAVKIRVLSPPWRTWWAITLYILAFSAAIGGYLLAQKRKLENERTLRRSLEEVADLKDQLLTDQRRRLRERREELADRERLIAELEAKNVALEEFNHTVSHDLKSPLVTIRGFLTMARQDAAEGDEDRLGEDLHHIEEAAAHMQELVESQLESLQSGPASEQQEELALDKIVQEAMGFVAGRMNESQAKISVLDELPTIHGYRTSLLSLFQNLLDNAMKFMGDQPNPVVEVGSQDRRGEKVFFVRDNGRGIAQADQKKIFGLFNRLDTNVEGTGIGLALVERAVHLHGGKIWVESEGVGHGSTFFFTLSAPQPSETQSNELQSSEPQSGEPH